MLLTPPKLLEIRSPAQSLAEQKDAEQPKAGFVAALHIELPISHSLENTYPAVNIARKFVLNISSF